MLRRTRCLAPFRAAVAKAPTDGGVNCLTLATALGARRGVPRALVCRGGAELSAVLVRSRWPVACPSAAGGELLALGGEFVAYRVAAAR
jgi:hypothetical protein